jgi:hypothetical protein
MAAPFHVTICGSKSFGELIISICPKIIHINKQFVHLLLNTQFILFKTYLHNKLVAHLMIFCFLTKHMPHQI